MRPIRVSSFFTRPGSMAGAINFASALDRTHQEFKDECDINSIMRRYSATGVMPSPWKSPPEPIWGDLASVPEFMEAQQLLITARESFADLPSKVRTRFNNDPSQLLAFVQDPKNLDEARALGLANPAPVPPVVPTP